KDAVSFRRIGAGDNGHDSIQDFSPSGVNSLDARVRILRVQDFPNQHAGDAEIVGVLARTGGLAGGVHHRDGFADYAEVRHFLLVHRRAGRERRGKRTRRFLAFSAVKLIGCRRSLLLRFYSRLDCFVHLTVTSTSAQITAKRISNLLLAGVRIHTQEMLHSNHESRCAIPALRSAPVPIGFLDSRQTAMLTYAFDRSDLLSLATT